MISIESHLNIIATEAADSTPLPSRYIALTAGGLPIAATRGYSVGEVEGNLLDFLDDPEVESWEEARDLGYWIGCYECARPVGSHNLFCSLGPKDSLQEYRERE